MAQRHEREVTPQVLRVQRADIELLEKRGQDFLKRISAIPIPRHIAGGNYNDPSSTIWCPGGLPTELIIEETLSREKSSIEVKIFARAKCPQNIGSEKGNYVKYKPWTINEGQDRWIHPVRI